MKIYKFLSLLFWIIRQFVIPNPFEVIGDGITIMIFDTPQLLTPESLNWIAGLVLPAITFAVVGLYYKKASAPAIGSILYMFFFCVHTGLLHLMSAAYPTMWLIIVIVVVYVALHITILILLNGRKI